MLKQFPICSKRLLATKTSSCWGSGGSSSRISIITTTTRRGASHHPKMEADQYTFGPYKIDNKEVFYSSPLSYAMVNLRPLLPGIVGIRDILEDRIGVHVKLIRQDVLVCPRREVKRFVDLTGDETSDLWIVAQKVGKQLEYYHKASSLTFAIQDGPQAGQTVPHVHIHIIPRKGGDFERNDEIYEAIDEKEKELKLDLDKDRKDRTLEEMAQEAEEYKKLFV